MYENEPVLIPDVPGKICFKNKKGSEYVQYETGRKYDPVRKYNVPERKIIGIRIPSLPEMMLPNENYYQYFEGDEHMNEEQKTAAKHYSGDRKRFIMLRELFDQMYYEFQLQSRRKPDDPVNGYKAMKINSILEPLREIMGDEEYAAYLDLVDVSTETGQEEAETLSGKSYSDVALMLTQYKGAIKRFNNERM
jgi:hypothetical protein